MKVHGRRRSPHSGPRSRRGAGAHRRPRPRSTCGVAEFDRTRWDPKDGELCPDRTSQRKLWVDVRSGSDVSSGKANDLEALGAETNLNLFSHLKWVRKSDSHDLKPGRDRMRVPSGPLLVSRTALWDNKRPLRRPMRDAHETP
ncbi:hypothetical protein JTE90_007357 [Oedothorax gibbosus]|uniref:Uncharacterized protein n=1 Tax=Oedothorax gibbosus TaxID=931172 RepID=A0AAV6TEN0_9ARAC|nr:hypothetical protein JTE90_007357 [Oedothorax gibbosus]